MHFLGHTQMHVAIVIEKLDLHAPGGSQLACHEIAVSLIRCGHKVTVVANRAIGTEHAPYTIVSRMPPGKIFRFERMWGQKFKYLWFEKWAVEHVANTKYDLVHAITPISHCHGYQPRAGLAVVDAIRRNGKSGSKIQLSGKQKFVHDIESRLANETRVLFLPHSILVLNQCSEHLRVPSSRLHLVENAVDTSPFLKAESNDWPVEFVGKFRETDFVCLFVARNLSLKGIDIIQNAARALVDHVPRICMMVVGSADYEPPEVLSETILSVGSAATRRDMASLYHRADVLVHPTHYDSCSRAVIEAIASGTPAITTVHDGSSEILKRHKCGIVIETKNGASELVAAIKHITDVRVRASYAENCCEALTTINIDRHVDELLGVYSRELGIR